MHAKRLPKCFQNALSLVPGIKSCWHVVNRQQELGRQDSRNSGVTKIKPEPRSLPGS